MTLKAMFRVLAGSAVLALSLPALAQTTTTEAPAAAQGPNVKSSAIGTKGAVATLAMAQNLYALGMTNKDALTVLTAAKLAGSVDVKEVERKKDTKGTEVAGEAEGKDLPVDAATMMVSAKQLAGEDEMLAGLVEDALVEAGRGRVGGVSSTLSRLTAGQTDTWELPFYGDSYAELAVPGDGDSNLDVLVTDESGNTICYDVSGSDMIYCDFVPAWNGYFYVTVQNNGSRRNSYYLITN